MCQVLEIFMYFSEPCWTLSLHFIVLMSFFLIFIILPNIALLLGLFLLLLYLFYPFFEKWKYSKTISYLWEKIDILLIWIYSIIIFIPLPKSLILV